MNERKTASRPSENSKRKIETVPTRLTFVHPDDEGVRRQGDQPAVAVNQVGHVFSSGQRCSGDCERLRTHTSTHTQISTDSCFTVIQSRVLQEIMSSNAHKHAGVTTHTHTSLLIMIRMHRKNTRENWSNFDMQHSPMQTVICSLVYFNNLDYF